ncbi:MAG: hypothetical protein Q4Q00_05540 [Turicibacter sp.]|nr:hypothetical protein [Turicibacter sp.]
MDLSNYESLRACSMDEVLHQLRQAKCKLELYVSDINPDLFVSLQLPTSFKANVVTSREVLSLGDDEFLALFHRVLYESVQIEIDLKEEKRIKYFKTWCFFFIIVFSLLFVGFNEIKEMKVLLFMIVMALCGCLYVLLKHKTKLFVSEIKRRTNFKVMADSFLGFLPTVYIIDEKMYIGANLLKRPCNMELYAVESEEEQEQLKAIYDQYVMANRKVKDEFIIGLYFERMHSNELSTMRWQE